MSATFYVREDCAWIPRSGTFESILELIAEEITGDMPNIANTFRQVVEWHDTYVDISELTREEFRKIVGAVQKIQKEILEDSPNERYRGKLGLIGYLSELKAGLLLDPRSGYPSTDTGRIVINTVSSWETVGWMYNIILEEGIAWLRHNDEHDLATSLLSQWLGKRQTDLSTLSGQQFRLLFQCTKNMYQTYGDAKVRRMNCEEFLHAFAPKISELYEKFKADPRAEGTQETSLDSLGG